MSQSTSARRAFIVVGMAYGDEGKGSCVDWLVREHGARLVVRFNGGSQAAHHVVTPEGFQHTFSTFGAGTFAGADTYLSEHVLVNPLKLAIEAYELKQLGVLDPFRWITIHPQAPITTPYHVALNRLREMSRGRQRHGSCGLGIGETMVDVLKCRAMRWGDLSGSHKLRTWTQALDEIRKDKLAIAVTLERPDPRAGEDWEAEMKVLRSAGIFNEIVETFDIVARAVKCVEGLSGNVDTVIFEGAQGILLDEDFGFAPYHTWSKTMTCNAREVLESVGFAGEVTALGVIRAYLTRHGRGPLPTEDPMGGAEFDATNPANAWQESFRFGWPDFVTTRYVAALDRLDGMVVTCVDKLTVEAVPCAESYFGAKDIADFLSLDLTEHMMTALPHYVDVPVDELPYRLAEQARVPLYAISDGPTAQDKKLMVRT